jgi:general secretion pathway protein G
MRPLYSHKAVTPSHRREAGFSLTEMLVVLVIMALLMALVAPNFLGRVGGARSQSAEAQIENLASALEIYSLDVGRYPDTESGLNALVEPPAGVTGWAGPYLRRGGVPLDPWGNAYLYTSNGPDHFSLRSLGRDGQPGGSGEDRDIETAVTLIDPAESGDPARLDR